MVFREILEKLRGKSEDPNYMKELDKKMRAEEILMERKKSANQRELERYYKEDNEARIKKNLEFMRKKRERDIMFNHNPINTKNVVSHTDWEILREENQFTNKHNIFSHEKNIFNHNPYLFI